MTWWPDPKDYFWDDWTLLVIQLGGLVALVIYVWKTWQMASATNRAAQSSLAAVEESRNARLEALAPRIVVYFDGGPRLTAEVVIYNAGSGTAGDLKLAFNPPLQTSGDTKLLEFFDAVQSVVPPGYRISQMFDAWPGYFEANLPGRYEVTATYTGLENGTRYRTNHVLDVQGIRHRLVRGERDPLESIKKSVDQISQDFRRLKQSLEDHFTANAYQVSLLGMPSDGGQLVIRLWRAATGLGEQSYIRDWGGFLKVVQSLAAAALVHRDSARVTQDQVDALSKVVSVLHSEMADVMGNREWYAEVDHAIADLERAYGEHTGLSEPGQASADS